MIKHYLYITLIFALLAFGKWYTDQAHAAGYNEAKAKYESALRKDLNDQIAKNNVLTAKNSQLVTDLLDKQPEIRTVYKTIEKKVNVYVKQNIACNLNYASYWLLNSAAQAEWMSEIDDTSIPDDKKREATSITQADTIGSCIGWAETYNNLAKRHDVLIDVIINHNGPDLP